MDTPQAPLVRHADEREARQTAEEARESGWHQPSFGKQLYLGDLRLDLIHPHPRPDDEAVRRGGEFCARLRAFCEESVDGNAIERDAKVRDEVVTGLAALGAFGLKISPAYGGLGLTHLYYNRALMIVGPAALVGYSAGRGSPTRLHTGTRSGSAPWWGSAPWAHPRTAAANPPRGQSRSAPAG